MPLFTLLCCLLCCVGCRRRCHRKRMKKTLEALAKHPELKAAVEAASGTSLPVAGWKRRVHAALDANPRLKEAVSAAVVAHKAEEKEAGAAQHDPSGRHHRGLFRCCRCVAVCSGTFMLVSLVCSLLQQPPPPPQEQREGGGGGGGGDAGEEYEEGQQPENAPEPNPLVGFLFAVVGGLSIILACSLLCKLCRCCCRCLCSSTDSSRAEEQTSSGARSSGAVTIDVPPPTPLGYTALPSEPLAAGLTVHIVEAQREQPPKPLEAL